MTWRVSFHTLIYADAPFHPSSSSSFSFSPSTLANKGGGPFGWLGTCAEVNPNRGAMATGHGLGSVSPWGVSEGTQGPSPRKGKQMAAGIAPPMDCTCSPPKHPSLCSHSTGVQRTLWGLWSGRMSQWRACLRSIGSQGPCWLLHNAARLTDTLSQTDKHISCLRPFLLHCFSATKIWLPVGKNKWGRKPKVENRHN